jgi:hypothetical protein
MKVRGVAIPSQNEIVEVENELRKVLLPGGGLIPAGPPHHLR